KEICKIKSLEDLSIGVTKINEESLIHLVRLKRLQKLEMRGLNITDVGLKAVGRCLNLRELNFGGPDYRPFGPTDFTPLGNLKKLEVLNVTGAKVTDAHIKGLGMLSALRRLHLGRNEVSDVVLAEISPLKELRSLDLFQTRISG